MVYQKIQKIWIIVLCIGSGARQAQPQFRPWLCDCHSGKAAAAAFALDCAYVCWLDITDIISATAEFCSYARIFVSRMRIECVSVLTSETQILSCVLSQQDSSKLIARP